MKPFPNNEVVDYAAPSNYLYGVASGLDLPEPLKKLQCRQCGETVAGLDGCPECERRKREAAKERRRELRSVKP